jgi:hypothetical protein
LYVYQAGYINFPMVIRTSHGKDVPCHPHREAAASMVAVGPVSGMGRAMHSLRRNRIVIGRYMDYIWIIYGLTIWFMD